MLIFLCPPGYTEFKAPVPGQRAFRRHKDKMCVIVTIDEEVDGRTWLHVSLSFPDRLPTFKDVRSVKRIFMGKYHYAAMIFPPEKYYVNQNPFVLHIFACPNDEWPLPEFTRYQGTL